MSYKTIETERHERVVLIRLNRPKELNALNQELLRELVEALNQFDREQGVGAIVITGNSRAFAAGADIKEMADADAPQMLTADPISLWDQVGSIQKPVIAAVSGWCLGGGNELAMACDMILASESAKFGQPEINLGVIPGAGGTQRLTRIVGKPIAMEMVLNNRTLNAQEALQYGLVNRVYPDDQLLDEALKLADEIAARAPIALRLAKEAVLRAEETLLSDGIHEERRSFYFLFSTEDQKEGMQAFLEKRQPEWKGK
jgi:enoyl-CoA hydratase